MALVGQWLLASVDGSGITPDSSGAGFHGTVKPTYPTNMPAVGEGPCSLIPGGMVFDGGDDYVNVGRPHVVGDVYTIAAWVKPNSLTRITIYSAGNSGATPVFSGCYLNDGALELATPGVFNDISDAGVLTAGKWAHVAYSRGGVTPQSGRIFYVNGAKVGTRSQVDVTHVNNAADVTIGCRSPSSQSWAGSLADVRLYSTALSAAEVYDIYQKSLRNNAALLGVYP